MPVYSSMSSLGRVMPGRRGADGQHQAIEAKETWRFNRKNADFSKASPIRISSLLYPRLDWHDGTAKDEEVEFEETYKLEVDRLYPQPRPVPRLDSGWIRCTRTSRKWAPWPPKNALDPPGDRPARWWSTTWSKKSEIAQMPFLAERASPTLLNAKAEQNVGGQAEVIAQAGRAGPVRSPPTGLDAHRHILGGHKALHGPASNCARCCCRLVRPRRAPSPRFHCRGGCRRWLRKQPPACH